VHTAAQNLQLYIAQLERRLLERFDTAAGSKSKGANNVMHECVHTLQALGESHTVVQRWIATRSLFRDVSGFTVRPPPHSAMSRSAGTIVASTRDNALLGCRGWRTLRAPC
jgi:hypothetical protein